jgi:hypothetical protein
MPTILMRRKIDSMKGFKKYIVGGSMVLSAISSNYTLAGNEDRIGSSGASEMLVNPWARSSAMADAGIASGRGLEAQFVNIAGLAFTDKTQLKFNYTNWLGGGAGISLNSAGIAQRISKQSVIAVSIQAFGFGDIDITTVDIPEGGIGTFSPRKNIVNVGYAREFSNSIYAGMNLKIVSESIANLSATGVALDAGVQYITGEQDEMKFGITLRNVGPTMTFRGDGLGTPIFYQTTGGIATLEQRSNSFEMPSQLAIGASYDFIFSETNKLTTAFGFSANSFTNDIYRLGLDYGFGLDKAAFNIRAGYAYESNIFNRELATTGLTGFTAGFSVDALAGKNKSPIGVEYAVRLANPFGTIHTFGICISLK